VNYYHPMIAWGAETGQVVPPNKEALRLASLAKEISLLSPAALERVRAGLDEAIARAAAASRPKTRIALGEMAMAVTLKQLSTLLDKLELKHTVNEERRFD
jgi:hypothetical protein